MGSSYIKFNDQGFWASDGLLETWLLALVREIDSRSPVQPWLQNIRDDWYLQAVIGSVGCVCPSLDRHLVQETQMLELIDIAEVAFFDVRERNFSKNLKIEEWIGFGVKNTSLNMVLFDFGPVGQANLETLGQHFIELLKGKSTEPEWVYQ